MYQEPHHHHHHFFVYILYKLSYVFRMEWVEASLHKESQVHKFFDIWEFFIQTLPTDTQQSIMQCFQYTQWFRTVLLTNDALIDSLPST